MAEATFRHGNPVRVDYTAGADIDAGEVIPLLSTGVACGIAHRAIANTDQDALAVGGGVYDVKVASNYAAWTKVWWDDDDDVLTTTSTNNSLFGYTVETSPAANAVVKVLHLPHI
jgi:predicted RecA/RadA family phage recombinase